MRTHTFKGGIHPSGNKGHAESTAITIPASFPKTVSIPVTMGGAENEPLVKVGDAVVRGGIIADSPHPMSVPVHASISGTVKKIENRVVAGNIEKPCIIIEGDGSDTTAFLPPLDPFTASKDAAVKRVRDAGIAGMGGASFPTHVKLQPPSGSVIEYVIANGSECEPYLAIDARIMRERASKVVDGLAIAMHIVGAKKGIISIEEHTAYLVPILEKAIAEADFHTANFQATLSVSVCQNKYPQGGEKTLVKALLNREIPSGGLPFHIGCIMQNVATLAAISDAFREGKPLIERPLTISGGACGAPKNIQVPIGTLVSDLDADSLQVTGDAAQIIVGGPMMGISMPNIVFPIEKNTSGVLLLTKREANLFEEGACIGCAKCVSVCPLRLVPVMMLRSLATDDIAKAVKFGLADCTECGTCSFRCPAHVKLTQHFRVGRAKLRAEADAKKTAQTGGK